MWFSHWQQSGHHRFMYYSYRNDKEIGNWTHPTSHISSLSWTNVVHFFTQNVEWKKIRPKKIYCISWKRSISYILSHPRIRTDLVHSTKQIFTQKMFSAQRKCSLYFLKKPNPFYAQLKTKFFSAKRKMSYTDPENFLKLLCFIDLILSDCCLFFCRSSLF